MSNTNLAQDFQWEPQPRATKLVMELLNEFRSGSRIVRRLEQRLQDETGTRLCDWIDHLLVTSDRIAELQRADFEQDDTGQTWQHSGGLLPRIRIGSTHALAIKVESVDDFLGANEITEFVTIHGEVDSQFRSSLVEEPDGIDLIAVERAGYDGFTPVESSKEQRAEVRSCFHRFASRPRDIDEEKGFRAARNRFAEAAKCLGRDWACDLFFAAERNYWMARNRAAQIQRQRQDQVGLGWANHDHHTYRCSREHFADLVATLELMGFQCRERFYAGEQAGWGAQVLEHPVCGIVIFADVDMSPEEVSGDFAHNGLEPSTNLGTVGLWCKLHGESFLSAGLHHLECQFDFDAARTQLRVRGIETMDPFTDMPHLKQAFTVGETWAVDSERINSLVDAGSITEEQAEIFRTEGAIGSHLEILERNDGYKGFNQSGISDIIAKTDPRAQASLKGP